MTTLPTFSSVLADRLTQYITLRTRMGMGHAHYTDTAYYITAVPELLALAAQRRDAAGWLTEVEAPQ